MESGRHLLGMPGIDPGVVLSGGQQHGGVGRPVHDVVVGRVSQQRGEQLRILHGAVLGRVEPPVGSGLGSQRVHHRHRRDHRAGDVRPLGEHGTHQQSSVGTAHDRQPLATGDPAAVKMVRAGDEVVEAVLLGGEPAGVVPLLAELAAAADVGHHVDPALLQPQQQQAEHLAVRGIPGGKQVQGVRAEHACRHLSGMSATCHHEPPAPWLRRKTCHSPPSPFCTRSITQRPSGEADR